MPAAIFARLALAEARRGGLAWLAAASLAVGVCAAAFLSQLALTESRLLEAAVVAALLRICAVFIVAAQVVASVRREIDERRLELLLSLPLSRAAQYLGRLGGYAACAVVVAFAFSLPLLLWASPLGVGAWGLSLACELALVAAAALFFTMTLAQLVPALAATGGLYLLARCASALQAIARGPLTEETLANAAARHAVDAVAFLLPALDKATRTAWLLYGVGDATSYALSLGALVLYTAVLAAAGVIDFQRRGA